MAEKSNHKKKKNSDTRSPVEGIRRWKNVIKKIEPKIARDQQWPLMKNIYRTLLTAKVNISKLWAFTYKQHYVDYGGKEFETKPIYWPRPKGQMVSTVTVQRNPPMKMTVKRPLELREY